MQGVVVGPLPIPTQADGTVWLDYSPHDPRRFVSAADVLEGQHRADLFDQKLVLLGVTGLALVDEQITPLGPMPGSEIHAQLLENVLAGRLAARPDWTRWLEPALTAGFGAAADPGPAGAAPALAVSRSPGWCSSRSARWASPPGGASGG